MPTKIKPFFTNDNIIRMKKEMNIISKTESNILVNNLKVVTKLTDRKRNRVAILKFNQFPKRFKTVISDALTHFYGASKKYSPESLDYQVENHVNAGVMNEDLLFGAHQNSGAVGPNSEHVMSLLYYYDIENIETSLQFFKTLKKFYFFSPWLEYVFSIPIKTSNIIAFTDAYHQPIVERSSIDSKRKVLVIIISR